MEKYDKLMTRINEETGAYINKLQKVILTQAKQIEELHTKLQEQRKQMQRRRKLGKLKQGKLKQEKR